MEITAFNCHQALADGIRAVLLNGEETMSRNGPVLTIPEPVRIKYVNPRSRVLLSPTRDANPFFHLAEAAWMLAGRNDLETLQKYVSTFDKYSDDGQTLHGAYGHRWINHFGVDQLEKIVEELRTPGSRRAVLGMWDPAADIPKLSTGGKDVPCNTHAYFCIRNGGLEMTVCNRSNDAIFGCFGANLVHFSVLQEYLAYRLDVAVGAYYQFTNNLHIYTDVFGKEKLERIVQECDVLSSSMPVPDSAPNIANLSESMRAMSSIWFSRKSGETNFDTLLSEIPDTSWRLACSEWLERRKK